LLLEAVTGTSHVLEGRAYAFENRRGFCRASITPLNGASRGAS
jgi:hypothetical protein